MKSPIWLVQFSALLCAFNAMGQRPLPVRVTDSTNGPIYAIVTWKNELYIAGRFTAVEQTPAEGVAVKRGGVWYPLGSGVRGEVRCLAIDSSGGLYVGGKFDSVGGKQANNIAYWKDSTWGTLGGGVNDTVQTLATFTNYLFCGGSFTRTDGIARGPLAMWNGHQWDTTATGFTYGSVQFIEQPYPDMLRVSGTLNIATDSVPWGSVEWYWQEHRVSLDHPWRGYIDRTSQHRHGVIFASQIEGLYLPETVEFYTQYLRFLKPFPGLSFLLPSDGKRLLAGGTFTYIQGTESPYASFYDGATWRRFSPRPDRPILAGSINGRQIYLAGSDSTGGRLYSASYLDSITMHVDSIPAPAFQGPLYLNFRNDSTSTDTLVVFRAFGNILPSFSGGGIVRLAPGERSTYTSYASVDSRGFPNPWSAWLAVFSNSTDNSDVYTSITVQSQSGVAASVSRSPTLLLDGHHIRVVGIQAHSPLQWDIYDPRGCNVLHARSESEFDAADLTLSLPHGLYFARVQYNSTTLVSKFILE